MSVGKEQERMSEQSIIAGRRFDETIRLTLTNELKARARPPRVYLSRPAGVRERAQMEKQTRRPKKKERKTWQFIARECILRVHLLLFGAIFIDARGTAVREK